MRVAYLGPQNTYSHLAALNMTGQDDALIEQPTLYDVLMAVGDTADAAIVPIENSIEGGVAGVLDMLVWETDLYINAESSLKIDNRLFMREGADFSKVERILTHPQAYGQCRKYLSKRYPHANIVFTDSTAQAVKSLKDNVTAAIAGAHNLTKGLICSPEDIQDNPHNITRFVLLKKTPANPEVISKISIVFEAENKPGGLFNLLEIIKENNLNMSKIESRPYKGAPGRYVFFVDFNGNLDPKTVETALNQLKQKTTFYKFLGSY